MKSWLTNLIAKLVVPGWIWEKLDGQKTRLAAGASILSGLAGLISELAGPIAAHDTAAILALIQHLPSDNAWLLLVGGLGALGIGHKLEKQDAAAAASAK